MRLVRKMAGWLAIPASLFLMPGCATTGPASDEPAAPVSLQMQSSPPPFVQIFGEEAPIHIITFFDLYCMTCQQSAERLAEIQARLHELPNGSQARITGVGYGDTPFEVEVFLKRYPLPYTCHPDPGKTYRDPFQLRGTPTVLGFARIGDECIEVYRHEGRFRSEDLAKLMDIVQTHLQD